VAGKKGKQKSKAGLSGCPGALQDIARCERCLCSLRSSAEVVVVARFGGEASFLTEARLNEGRWAEGLTRRREWPG
jgi:hypothetical protein